ncbi:MAG: hypothetical protein NVSMB68_06010 [Thermoanaerobaculia bacterium]
MKVTSLVVLMFLTACASTSSDVQSGDADRAIMKSNERFSSAIRSGNVDRLMDFYSDSAVLMPPNEAALSGRAAVRQYWAGFLGAFNNIDLRLASDDVSQSCDLAVERGHYDLTMTPAAGGASVHDSGKYVVVRRRLNGQWKAVTDMYSSNMPVPR